MEWVYVRERNCFGREVGDHVKVRVIAERGKWAWVQRNEKAPFTVLWSTLLSNPPAVSERDP